MTQTIHLVTGAPRSGTSLLTALLSQLPGMSSLSQPAPLLPVGLKDRFLQRAEVTGALAVYPLADQQFQTFTPAEDFSHFLMADSPDQSFWLEWLDRMNGYSGRYTPVTDNESGAIQLAGPPAIDALGNYIRWLARPEHADREVAWKEVFAEELLPAWLSRGNPALLILRDPRDCLTSQLFGAGPVHAGSGRPLLFLCRQWRKSALYALGLQDRPGMKHVRYEDLVRDPRAALSAWWRREFPTGFPTIGDWATNGSFRQHRSVSTASIGHHAQHLPVATQTFIEAICFDEMIALGYPPSIDRETRMQILEGTHTPMIECPENIRPALSQYRWNASRRAEEFDRAMRINAPTAAYREDAFIFPTAFAKLRALAAN